MFDVQSNFNLFTAILIVYVKNKKLLTYSPCSTLPKRREEFWIKKNVAEAVPREVPTHALKKPMETLQTHRRAKYQGEAKREVSCVTL